VKGGITLAIYIAIGFIPVVFGPAAVGQSSTHVKQPQAPATSPAIDRGWAPSVMPDADEIVIIKYGQGGVVAEHNLRFAAYRNRKSKVEIRGPCYSACTLITAYVSKDNLCIAQGAFLAFHAVRSKATNEIMSAATALMYWQQPGDIRSWIDRTGGYQHLPLDGYWIMHDTELWAIGYPRCAP